MSESFPSFEQPKVTDEEVIEALRSKGIENSEAKELLLRWVGQNEAEANAEDTSTANIVCAMKNGQLYAKAGYREEALQELEDARQAAYNEHYDDLFNRIEQIMDGIERGS